jgi:hypothetical protein
LRESAASLGSSGESNRKLKRLGCEEEEETVKNEKA